ncbi:MAG TPA: hypothetical protein VFC99_05780 [Acidimicrobiia bacterium]|nr:hypothetical protein [Acidimicrobiia bacterium]
MAAQRDYRAEYARRKARLAERGETVYSRRNVRARELGFPSEAARRRAGSGATRWAQAVRDGLITDEGASRMISAGVTDPAEVESIVVSGEAGFGWTLEARQADGTIREIDLGERIPDWVIELWDGLDDLGWTAEIEYEEAE